MPRPPKARDELLDAAEALFLERGVTSAALDDICERAAVSKGALFYHFDSKSALAADAVRRFGDRLTDAVPRVGPESTARLMGFLDAVSASRALAAGCLLGMASLEAEPPVATVAGAALKTIRARLADLVAAASAEHDADVDAPGLATTILAAVEGGLVLDRHARGIPATKTAIGHVKTYLLKLLEEDA